MHFNTDPPDETVVVPQGIDELAHHPIPWFAFEAAASLEKLVPLKHIVSTVYARRIPSSDGSTAPAAGRPAVAVLTLLAVRLGEIGIA